jgi:hypothetical protein
MSRATPISLADPQLPVQDAPLWSQLNDLASGNRQFTPLEVKAFYVVGILAELCNSVEWLLKAEDAWPSKYLPAYVVFASAVDLAGRCLTGNSTARQRDNLPVGFHYLASPAPVPPSTQVDRSTVVVSTNIRQYTIDDLIALRNFAAHGQATAPALPGLHNELLDPFPNLMGRAMENYWSGLQTNRDLCQRLASARVGAYANRSQPLKETFRYFSLPSSTIGSLFSALDWHVRLPSA